MNVAQNHLSCVCLRRGQPSKQTYHLKYNYVLHCLSNRSSHFTFNITRVFQYHRMVGLTVHIVPISGIGFAISGSMGLISFRLILQKPFDTKSLKVTGWLDLHESMTHVVLGYCVKGQGHKGSNGQIHFLTKIFQVFEFVKFCL